MCFNVLFNMKTTSAFNFFLWWSDLGITSSMLSLLTFSNLSVLFCANPRMRAINAGGWIRLFVRSSSVKILFDFNISASATQPSNPNPFQDKLSLSNDLLRCKKKKPWEIIHFSSSKAFFANLHAAGLYIWLQSACVPSNLLKYLLLP